MSYGVRALADRNPARYIALPGKKKMHMRYVPRTLTILAVIAVLGLVLTLMPRGYDTDLSQIGQGRPAAVLVHDPGFVASTELMEGVNRLRGDYEPKMVFLLADLNTPQGRRFAAEQSVDLGTLVLFDAEGRRLASHSGRTGEPELRAFLDRHHR